MNYFLAGISSFILISISMIHFYWAFGGKKGVESALPSHSDGKKLFKPRYIETFAVAFILLGFACFFLQKIKSITIPFLSDKIVTIGLGIIASIFIIRAIGDFRYLGFFKRIKNSSFAEKDTKYYSPLCLFIGLSAIVLIWR